MSELLQIGCCCEQEPSIDCDDCGDCADNISVDVAWIINGEDPNGCEIQVDAQLVTTVTKSGSSCSWNDTDSWGNGNRYHQEYACEDEDPEIIDCEDEWSFSFPIASIACYDDPSEVPNTFDGCESSLPSGPGYLLIVQLPNCEQQSCNAFTRVAAWGTGGACPTQCSWTLFYPCPGTVVTQCDIAYVSTASITISVT